MFNVVELKFNAAEHKFNDVEHTFSDAKLSLHARRRFTYWGTVWHTLWFNDFGLQLPSYAFYCT